MDQIDKLFKDKTEEAYAILQETANQNPRLAEDNSVIPFEVSKVLNQINQETQRRKRVLKRKPA